MTETTHHRPTLVLGGTGKTGRRLVERVLGRPARDFADYARATAATGVWNPTDQPNPGGPR
jgi:uncharacterized protein YbjT (DUF2867 family)